MNNDNYLLFNTYPDTFAANIVKGLLESYDIPCIVADGNVVWGASFFNQDLGGVRLYIREEDTAKAAAILASDNAEPETCGE